MMSKYCTRTNIVLLDRFCSFIDTRNINVGLSGYTPMDHDNFRCCACNVRHLYSRAVGNLLRAWARFRDLDIIQRKIIVK